MRGIDFWEVDRDNAEVKGNLKILKQDNNGIKPSVKIWKGRALKPFANYYFNNVEKREEYINRIVNAEEENIKEKAKRKLARTGTPEMKKAVKVGTIFYSSWGYNQTNVDFYQVVENKGSFVKIREIGSELVEQTGWASETVKADKDRFIGEPMRKKIQFSAGEPYLRLNSFTNAYEWDGTPRYASHYA